MSTPDIERHLPIYADGELDGDLRKAVEGAVDDSEELKRHVERWRSLRQAARRGIHAESVPAGLQQRVAQQLRDERRRLRLRRITRVGGLAIAAVIVLGVGFVLRGPLGSKTPPPAAVVAASAGAGEFWAHHLHCVQQPELDRLGVRELSAAAACERLSAHFEFPVLAPDLSTEGWRLHGASDCTITTDDGAVLVAHVFYRREAEPGRFVSLFSAQRPIDLYGCETVEGCGGRRVYQVAAQQTADGAHYVMNWRENERGYAAAGDVDRPTLEQLVDRAQFAGIDLRLWSPPVLAAVGAR